MKREMKRPALGLLCLLVAAFAAPSFADNPPQGFTDPTLLQQVMSGQIVTQTISDTQYEANFIVRSFWDKVTTDRYQDAVVDYPHYPDVFEAVQEGDLVSVNADKTEYDYKLDILEQVGPISEDFYPTGHHSLVRLQKGVAEAHLNNTLTNYKDVLPTATQSIRLIPWQTGMLVEDTINLQANPQATGAALVKQRMEDFFQSYTANFRKALNGEGH